MSSSWFVQIMGEQQGPLTSAQLKGLARLGKIDRDSPVRLGTDGEWTLAERVQGLFDLPLQPAAPPAAASANPLPMGTVAPPPIEHPTGHLNGNPSVANGKSSTRPDRPTARKRKPRSFWGVVTMLIDLKFERYLTPWIIRLSWALLLLAAVIGLLLTFAVDVEVISRSGRDSLEVRMAQANLDSARAALEALKPSAESTPPTAASEFNFTKQRLALQNTISNSRVSLADKTNAAKKLVSDAEAQLAQAKAALPSRFAVATRHMPALLMIYALQVIGGILALMWIRVLLEACIVLFNIAGKLGSIDETLRYGKETVVNRDYVSQHNA